MPLSEDEQRILHEIEQSFYDADPDTARKLKEKTVYKDAGTKFKIAVLVFVVGFVVMVGTFTISLFLGLAGFLLMLGALLFAERNLRRMGKAGWSDLNRSLREKGIANPLGKTGQVD